MNQNDLIRIDHAPAKRSGCSLPAAAMLDARYAAGELDRETYLQRNREMSWTETVASVSPARVPLRARLEQRRISGPSTIITRGSRASCVTAG